VAYWPFDDTYNDAISDNTGAPRGTEPIAFIDSFGALGKAISLNGEDQFVEIVGGDENNLEFPYDALDDTTGSMSISGWFRVAAFDTSWQCLLSKGEGENYRVARRGDTTVKIGYAGGVGEPTEAAPDVDDGLWHHFVAITTGFPVDGFVGTDLYIDGVLAESNPTQPALDQSDLNLMIGENPGARGREWEGDIDEIAIWNRAITADEVAELYDGGSGKPISSSLADTDGDGMSDAYEINHGLDPNVSNLGMDTDNDGLEDIVEHDGGTHPNKADTDDDGYLDGVETNTGVWVSLSDTGTNPVSADTDNDGLLDGVENNTRVFVSADNTGTNPLDKDTDNDGLTDGEEVAAGSDPNKAAALKVGSLLIANWPFDGDLTDPVGGHDGIAHTTAGSGTLEFVDGKFGQGVDLEYSLADYVEAGGPESDFDRGGGSVSLSMWFRVDSFDVDWQALIAKGEGSNYRLARRGATQTIGYAGGVGEPGQAAPDVYDANATEQVIHHVVAVTRAGFQTELWIDGVLYEVAAGPNISDDDNPLLIGANPGADPVRNFGGLIDDVGIWARALEPAEIQLIYNNGDGATIASLLDTSVPAITALGINFGADEPDGADGGTLAATDVAGASGVAQANWNNLDLLAGTATALTAETASGPSPTTVSVEWTSAGTWSSTGRSEENNGLTGADLTLTTGYLDTGADDTTMVTISSLPGTFAQAAYDVYVYALGGVAGRGGGYRIVDGVSGEPLTDYILAQSPASPTAHAMVPTDDPAAWGEGTYMVFKQLTASSITVEATTVDPLGIGSPNRAPINAIQLIPSPEGPRPKANIAWVSFHPADDTPSTAAGDAGFTEAPDVLYTSALRNGEYAVDRIITSATPDTALLNTYDLVIISRSVSSSHYQDAGGTAWNGITAPMIVMGGYPIRSSRMGYTTGTTIPDTAGTVALIVNDTSHPVFAGIPLDSNNMMLNPYAYIMTFNDGTQDIVQQGISVNSSPVAGDGTALAVIGTDGDPAIGGMVVGEWQAGATMGNSAADTLGGHRLVFLSGSREADITSEGSGIFDLSGAGTQMFLNAVDYMVMPPAVGDAVVDMPTITGTDITITWSGGGELYTSPDLVTWTATGNSSGTYTEAVGAGVVFYMVR